tara:strand:+ start:335 stop:760 length:426 start_codon:yes stop_codon:yes gene_type:complete
MVLIYPVVAKRDKNGSTTSFLIKNNMAFKINPPFDLSDLSTSIFERDMGEDPVFARTPKNGVIVLNKDLKNPVEKAKTIAHEKVHIDQYKSGELDYEVDGAGKGYVNFKGKTFDYSVMQKGKGPWEKPAYAAEKTISKKSI